MQGPGTYTGHIQRLFAMVVVPRTIVSCRGGVSFLVMTAVIKLHESSEHFTSQNQELRQVFPVDAQDVV